MTGGGWVGSRPIPFLLALLASCGQEDPAFRPDTGGMVGTGTIVVTSSIPGAAITLDGNSTGRVTPDTLREVTRGTHRIRVFLGGYEPNPMEHEQAVAADSLHIIHFDMNLIQGAGSIGVEATYPAAFVDGAAIFLDGAATGLVAPDTVQGIAAGEHGVTLVLAGFAGVPDEIHLTVLADLVVTADFEVVIPKRVVCEDFSNYGCFPCVPADAALRAAVGRIEAGRAMPLNPHLNFPTPGDPMYSHNSDANVARQFFFQVSVMPAIFANGTRVLEPTSADAIEAAIETELAQPSPVAIAVRATLGPTEYRITVDVWAVGEGIPSDLLLFTCVVETQVDLDPPGPNGLSEYRNVLRHFYRVPDPPADLGGETLGELRPGDRRAFDYTYSLPGGVDPTRLATIAFAQESASHRIIQVGTSLNP